MNTKDISELVLRDANENDVFPVSADEKVSARSIANLAGGAVNSVNTKTGDVVLNAEDVEAIPITEKNTFATITQLAEKTNNSDLSPVAKSGNYDDLNNTPILAPSDAEKNTIQSIKVNGVEVEPDADRAVNITTSGGGGGEMNVIEGINLNGVAQEPDGNKIVNLNIPSGGDVTYESQAESTVTLGIPTKPHPANRSADTIKILCIGNSFTDDMLSALPQMLLAMGDANFKIAKALKTGSSLQDHYKNFTTDAEYSWQVAEGAIWGDAQTSTISAIIAQDWDVIVFQQVSSLSGVWDSVAEFLPNMITYAKATCANPNVKFGYQSVWAYSSTCTLGGFLNYNNDQMTMYNAQIDVAKQIIANYPDVSYIIPNGTLVQSCRSLELLNAIGDELTLDSSHIKRNQGSLILGLGLTISILESLYGVDFSTIEYTAFANLVTGVTQQEFNAIMTAAEVVREDPLALRDLNTFVVGQVNVQKELTAGSGIEISGNVIKSTGAGGSLIEDFASSVIELSIEDGNTYIYGTLASLRIRSSTNYLSEALIKFSSGVAPTTLYFGSSIRLIGDQEAVCEAEKDYVIRVKGGMVQLLPLYGGSEPPAPPVDRWAVTFSANWNPSVDASKYFVFLDASGNEMTTATTETVAIKFKEGMEDYGGDTSAGKPWSWSKLSSLVMPEVGSLTTLEGYLENAQELINLSFPNSLGGVTTLRNFAVNCKKLKQLVLPKNTEGVLAYNLAFQNCIALESAVLSNSWDGVLSAPGMFSGCTSLAEVQMAVMPSALQAQATDFFKGTAFTSMAPGIEVAPGVYKSPEEGVLPEELWFERCGLVF